MQFGDIGCKFHTFPMRRIECAVFFARIAVIDKHDNSSVLWAANDSSRRLQDSVHAGVDIGKLLAFLIFFVEVGGDCLSFVGESGHAYADDDCADKIKELGVEFFCTFDNNRSTNPLKIFSLKSKYVKIINEFKPDVVFTFMLKPNIFGTRAAKKAGVKKVFSMVEGAGDAFIYDTLKWKVIRAVVSAMYKKSFKINHFLNFRQIILPSLRLKMD